MNKSKAYQAVAVNGVSLERLSEGHQGQELVVGCDIGKYQLLAVPRWPDGSFGRPWRVDNPQQIPHLLALLRSLAQGRSLRVALEPSGTYGDALRQTLHDAHLPVLRVSPKAAHDYAEIFDGVPSQHDGKDAAVVAELAALGKAVPWDYQVKPLWEQQLLYEVDLLEAQRRLLNFWTGRLEALLARHWPEATRLLKLTSAALLLALTHYGSPAALAADEQAEARLRGWGRRLPPDKARQFVQQAQQSVGVRAEPLERQRVQEQAQQALQAQRQMRRCGAALRRLAAGQEVLQAQGKVVGPASACVLWASVGDPRDYPCGQAYRKAMGLNLTERSSGTYQGGLHISKRGQPQARRWLYLAALRLVKQEPVRAWYRAKKERDGGGSKRALVGVMRKLALALYQVGAKGAVFQASRLVAGREAVGGQEGLGVDRARGAAKG